MSLIGTDFLAFKRTFWPTHEEGLDLGVFGFDVYAKEMEIAYSVEHNDETYVQAANMMGKDFITGLIALKQILCNQWARIITTSVVERHLSVLWDEIKRFILGSSLPHDRRKTGVLLAENGGPIILHHFDIRLDPKWGYSTSSYLWGIVSEKGEKMSGHHAPYTLLIGDEASGIDDSVYVAAQGWASKFLFIGNPNPCNNFYYRGCEAGDLPYGKAFA